MGSYSVVTHSAHQTVELGRKIGQNLIGGEIICLVGNLGSGKTHLIKGVAAGLGVDESGQVSSPTFVLVNEYSGPEVRLDVYHIDAYRLDSIAEFEMLGFDDICHDRSVVLIEWADKVESVLGDVDYIRAALSHISRTERKIDLDNVSAELEAALNSSS